ncbi:hypothetical protein BCR34DRAFT_391381 [Clohesyomyces aquaticus]|uniref:Uncharacterized protein n=1 Tax=Clohesyomyces aquaticus TaxID=1231657 RepID=A0A1Y1ZFP3_9PLEO|nr:hypothetical protein BCR34DRAFT_391381 [Clohesyomyces aquaticus]
MYFHSPFHSISFVLFHAVVPASHSLRGSGFLFGARLSAGLFSIASYIRGVCFSAVFFHRGCLVFSSLLYLVLPKGRMGGIKWTGL